VDPFVAGFMAALEDGLDKEGMARMVAQTPGLRAVAMGKERMGAGGARIPSIIAGTRAGPKVLRPRVQKPAGGLLSNIRRGTTQQTGLNPKAKAERMGLTAKPKMGQ